MAYATQDELMDAAGGAAAYLQLTDIDDDGAADAAVVARAQAAAHAWINSFLGSRYATPVANPTAELRRLEAEETIYRLRASKPAAAIGEFDTQFRRDRETQLKAYQSGSLRPDIAANMPSTGRAVVVTAEDAGADVSRSSLKGMW